MNNGYILLHRKIIKEWEWYSNINDTRVFIHCLLSANWEDGWFSGIKIPRGSFATSYKNLAKEVGISIQQLRTSLEHLKSTHNITHETNKQFSIITIQNYDKYQINQQAEQQTINKRLTNDQQTINNNIINNNKEQKNNIKEKINKKEKYGQFENVLLTDDEYQKLRERFIDYQDKIENLSGYIASRGDKYKSHYATIINWARKDSKQETLPDWFDEEIKEKERTEDDERELQELIRGY